MSQTNVEFVHEIFEAWRRGDMQAAVEGLDPEFEWDFSAYPLPDYPDHGKGVENWLRLLAEFRATWVGYEAEFPEVVDAGEHVVVVVHETMRVRGSDVRLERDVFQVTTVRDGRIARIRAYRTREEALEAVGLAA